MHAEKFYAAGVRKVWFIANEQGRFIGIRESTPFLIYRNKTLTIFSIKITK